MTKRKTGTTERKPIESKESKERKENKAAAADAKRVVQKAIEAREKAAREVAKQQRRKRPCNCSSKSKKYASRILYDLCPYNVFYLACMVFLVSGASKTFSDLQHGVVELINDETLAYAS